MKLTQGILGCALAAGLMAFAADQAQAIIINGDNYVPFNLKLKGSFDDGGKIKKHSFSSKDALKDAGFNGKVTLALGPGTENEFDVYVIQKNGKNSTVMADLSTNGVFVVDAEDPIVDVEKGNTESVAGIVHVSYDSEESILATSEDDFELDGVYSASETDNNNGKINQKFKATSLSGSGFFEEIEEDATLEGSASGSSGGKFED
jgi:hypothetical protein